MGSHECSSLDICINTYGGYDCQLECGFNEVFTDCIDVPNYDCRSLVWDIFDGWIVEASVQDISSEKCDSGCKCREGFYLDDSGHCVTPEDCDLNICKTNPNICGDHGFCISDSAEVECDCEEGYEWQNMTYFDEMSYCVDINECLDGACSGIQNSVCVNLQGSYSCECSAGFEKTKAGFDKEFRCLDVDECRDPSTCLGDNRTCRNTPGSYLCGCEPGYFNLDNECHDIDECNRNKHECRAYETCVNTKGSYECQCSEAFLDSDFCTDNCAENPCHESEKCINGIAGFTCVCPKGYSKKNGVCEDINECTEKLDNCFSLGSICINDDGGFHCECKPGYLATKYFERTICENIDECIRPDLNDCRESEYCKDSIGSYTCSCKKGYSRDLEGNCEDIDECARPLSCFDTPYSECVNTLGSYECVCRQGFYLKKSPFGAYCDDVNECLESPCTINNGTELTCLNTKGSYLCNCPKGYEFDMELNTCVDINECTNYQAFCPFSSGCENTPGSYICLCEPGFKYNKKWKKCVNYNECDDESIEPLCDYDSGAVCSDTWGSYTCSCPLDMIGSGYPDDGCSKRNMCDDDWGEIMIEGDCSEPYCFDTCESILKLNGLKEFCTPADSKCDSPRCVCPEEHVRLSLDDPTCVHMANCTCPDGYEGGFSFNWDPECNDINECFEGIDNCGENSRCFNTPGSFECYCQEGFIPVKNEQKERQFQVGPDEICVDLDECTIGMHMCPHEKTCINTVGSFKCKCGEGFRSEGKSCEDVDECKEGLDTCDKDKVCVNTIGSFTCQCPAGYESMGEHCFDVDECVADKLNECQSGTCTNSDGSYNCECSTGFSGHHCDEDINECELEIDDCPVNSECLNTKGSFECHCNSGFVMNIDPLRDEMKQCADINECSFQLDNCDQKKATCENTVGSYECVCKDGYFSKGNNCYDVNECEVDDLNNCDKKSGALCVDYDGGFKCVCLSGDNAGTTDDPCSTCPPNSTPTDCLPTDNQCVYNCNAWNYDIQIQDTCTENLATVCEQGCQCDEGFVKVDGPHSACVKTTDCDVVKCPANEYFDRCATDCEDSCDTTHKFCTEDCANKCVCEHGFVRESDEPGAPCVEEVQCKIHEAPEVCPTGELKVACLDSCFQTCDDVRRGVKRTTNCEIGKCIKMGCQCPPGTVRKSASVDSACVPLNECSEMKNLQTENFFLMMDHLPPRVSYQNEYSHGYLINHMFGTSEFINSTYGLDKDKFEVVDLQIIGKTYRKINWEVIEYAALIQYVDQHIDREVMAQFETNYRDPHHDSYLVRENTENKAFLRYKVVSVIEELIDPYFPCYSIDCDIEALACPANEIAGCASDEDLTCQAALQDEHANILAQANGLQRAIEQNPLLKCKKLKCVCPPGFKREGVKGKCVPDKECFGGCPRYSKYVGSLSLCEATCDDQDGSKCRENIGEELEVYRLPGCKCLPGYVKESNEPWARCISKKECPKPEPKCPENSSWQDDAPACFTFCDRLELSPKQIAECNADRQGMCVCDEGYYKLNPNPKSPCVSIDTCLEEEAKRCGPNEEFKMWTPRCFDDCRSLGYKLNTTEISVNCHKGEGASFFNPSCVCKPGFIRKTAGDHKYFNTSPCVEFEKACPKPKTKALHIAAKRNKLPTGVDQLLKETWGPLLEGMPKGVEVFAIGQDVQRNAQYNVVYRYD